MCEVAAFVILALAVAAIWLIGAALMSMALALRGRGRL
jgi:hypothetical protein